MLKRCAAKTSLDVTKLNSVTVLMIINPCRSHPSLFRRTHNLHSNSSKRQLEITQYTQHSNNSLQRTIRSGKTHIVAKLCKKCILPSFYAAVVPFTICESCNTSVISGLHFSASIASSYDIFTISNYILD